MNGTSITLMMSVHLGNPGQVNPGCILPEAAWGHRFSEKNCGSMSEPDHSGLREQVVKFSGICETIVKPLGFFF